MPCWHGKQRCKPLRRPTAEISERAQGTILYCSSGDLASLHEALQTSTRERSRSELSRAETRNIPTPSLLLAYPSSAGGRLKNLPPYPGRDGINQTPLFLGMNAVTTGFAIMVPGFFQNPQGDGEKENGKDPNDNVVSASEEFFQPSVLATGAAAGVEFFIGGHKKGKILANLVPSGKEIRGNGIGLGPENLAQANPQKQISISPCSRKPESPDSQFLHRPWRRSSRKPHNFPLVQYHRSSWSGYCRWPRCRSEPPRD